MTDEREDRDERDEGEEPRAAPAADPGDPLLRALRELPARSPDRGPEARLRREARAAFVRAFDDEPWHTRVLRGGVGRAAVPVVLAGVVGIYLMWAISAAAALTQ